MTAVSVPSGAILIADGDPTEAGIFYVATTHGKIVYKDGSQGNKFNLADKNTINPSYARGIAIGDHAAGEKGLIALDGSTITFASSCLTAGVNYYLGDSGAIIPEADIASDDYICYLGQATSTTVLKLAIKALGVLKP